MSIVKIRNKKALEQLQAKISLRIGRKPTQQELLDFCVLLANKHFDELAELITNIPKLSVKKAELIIEKREQLKDVPYDLNAGFVNKEDQDIYKT
ncbi:MAG: hypothetical protein ACTSQG_02185 [Promethearchaeota archaeon]